MKLREETIRIQEQFGAYCRTGSDPELPGLTPGRIHHYRRLVSNVVSNTLEQAFPITLAALDEETWGGLVEDFLAAGFPRTPQVWKLPLEFYHHHAARESGIRLSLPYLDDLLYFEWMEIEIHTMPDRPRPAFQLSGNLFINRLVFNPEYEILKLEYPVHTRPVSEARDLKGEYYVLIYRVPESGQVQFMDLSALHVYIITRLKYEDLSLQDMKNEIGQVAGIESGKYLDDALTGFLGDLSERKMILGYLEQ